MAGSDRSDEQYNYTSFPHDGDVEDFQRFPEIMKAGTCAPDPVLTDLDSGDEVRLSDVTRQGVTVLEFGSLT